MSGSGLHRKGKRKMRKYHWGRPSVVDRLKQSRRDRGLEPTWLPKKAPAESAEPMQTKTISTGDKHIRAEESKPENKPGFLRKIFNRKVGS